MTEYQEMKIPQCSPLDNFRKKQPEILKAIGEVLESGRYILGPAVEKLEREFAAFCGCRGAIGVANGTDAVELALRSLNLPAGSLVACPDLTASATAAAIQRAGCEVFPIDLEPDTCTISPQALRQALADFDIRAIVAVHLYGQPADLPAILSAADGRPVIEDCAQAHGALLDGRRVGVFGYCGAFSFYPTKNLGAIGDGGMIVCDDPELLENLAVLRQYGWRQRFDSAIRGVNSRLDELQAAILLVKLAELEKDNRRRREIAARYDAGFRDLPLQIPKIRPGAFPVYHQYVIRAGDRDALREFLRQRGIATAIHYPKALHQQAAFRPSVGRVFPEAEAAVREILSLPMYPELTENAVETVIAAVREFFR